jgi:hypothetical protein
MHACLKNCLYIEGRGEVSWYPASTLALIRHNADDELARWKREAEERHAREGGLDWIFANSEQVLKAASGSTVATLAECLGISNLWGAHGEGISYYANALQVMMLAEPYLRSGDRAGWDEFAAANRGKVPTADYAIG